MCFRTHVEPECDANVICTISVLSYARYDLMLRHSTAIICEIHITSYYVQVPHDVSNKYFVITVLVPCTCFNNTRHIVYNNLL